MKVFDKLGKAWRAVVPILIVIGLLAWLNSCVKEQSQIDYDRGYRDGYEEGQIAGYEDGYRDGHDSGWNEGFDAGLEYEED